MVPNNGVSDTCNCESFLSNFEKYLYVVVRGIPLESNKSDCIDISYQHYNCRNFLFSVSDADVIRLNETLQIGGINQLTPYIRSKLKTTQAFTGCLGVRYSVK